MTYYSDLYQFAGQCDLLYRFLPGSDGRAMCYIAMLALRHNPILLYAVMPSGLHNGASNPPGGPPHFLSESD
ncbi:hypothetical protein EB241_05375 [Erwinia psidii]|uniref:Uncharacterized protein n=1 Tax=Erwinia psidii TaxID=69224 RepID=A0A3N6V284_9GAMM|nr:hypothetical protein EB241_05375 [Erwinia psidii]